MQKEVSLLSSLNADKLFVDKAQAEEIRVKVSAHILQLQQKLDDSYQVCACVCVCVWCLCARSGREGQMGHGWACA